jgi:hypothetical protein
MRIQQFSERVAAKHVIKSTKAGQRDNWLAARSVRMSSLIFKMLATKTTEVRCFEKHWRKNPIFQFKLL